MFNLLDNLPKFLEDIVVDKNYLVLLQIYALFFIGAVVLNILAFVIGKIIDALPNGKKLSRSQV